MSNRRRPMSDKRSILPEGVSFVDTSTKEGVDALIDANMAKLVEGMTSEMGRMPTEDEVMHFINGSNIERATILARGRLETRGSQNDPDL